VDREEHSREAADAEDADRIARVGRGDLEAFRQLFHRYYPRVYAFVQRRVRDPALSEDVVVEVFYELWRSAARFRGQSRPSTFLCGIAHFKCLSALRAEGRGKRSAVIPTDTTALARHASASNLGEELESREQIRRVRAALGTLPDGQREVVEMAFVDGLAYGEIAERLGVAEGTVKTRVARARAQLRRFLAREEGNGDMEEPS
jgi:RNA polymerase sigma-70 factor (ECF subfamily)